MPTAGTLVWNTWVTASDTTTVNYSTNGVWQVWCDGIASTSATSSGVWVVWNAEYKVNGSVVHQYQQHQAQPETEEQKQARLRREEEARLAEEARKKAEAESKRKAEELLVSQLNPVQRKQLKEMDAFMVELQMKRYKIRRGQRVLELDKDNKPVAQYCIHPSDYQIPSADVMLAQKLLLEHDEDAFLRIANRSSVVQ